jgi:hypothetical protein
MDEKTIRMLEREVEEAVREVIGRLGLRKLPIIPRERTMHLMAKAAVAVYEAVAEKKDHLTAEGESR